MKAITREWLARALDDLRAAKALLDYPALTHLASFHAQQVVEKVFKAILEEYERGLLRIHSLTRLLEIVKPHLPVNADQDMLDRLEAVYIAARYPSELGLLPYGKPSLEDAAAFCAFAEDVYQQVHLALETGSREDG